MKHQQSMKPVTKKSLFLYGFMALPLAFAGLPIYLHAPDFYAREGRLPLEWIGFALLLLRLIDAVQDPYIGALSDRFSQRRSAILLTGLVLLITGFIMIFNPSFDASSPTLLAWLAVSVFLCTTGYSILTINLQGLGGLWDVPQNTVTHVMAARESMGLVGLLLASIIPSILFSLFDRPTSFFWLSIGYIPLVGLGFFMLMHWMKQTTFLKSAQQTALPFATVFKSRSRALFFITYVLYALASAIPATLIIFYVRDFLGSEDKLGLFLVLYFLSGALGMPIWNKIAARTSTLKAWGYSMIMALLVFIWAFGLEAGDDVPYAVICVLSGIAFGANLTLPSAHIAQLVRHSRHESLASRYYALLAFLAKFALALATGISLPLLGFYGYIPGIADSASILPYAYALIPCLLQLITLVFWRLTLISETTHND